MPSKKNPSAICRSLRIDYIACIGAHPIISLWCSPALSFYSRKCAENTMESTQ